MTNRRFLSYRRARRWIEFLEERRADPESVLLLRQTAEDLLLSRGSPTEVQALQRQADATLGELVELGVVTAARAREIEHALRAAGPGALEVIAAGA